MGESQRFTGDKHAPMKSPLAGPETRLINAWTPRFPRWIETYHLTMMTVAWSLLLLLAGWLAARTGCRHWLWLSSVMLALQWFTDAFDGSIGRYRDTGLRRWGFYMDHFLDYIFMACVFGHYAFLLPPPSASLVLVMVPVYGAFEVNSWLEYGATGEFHITYGGVGPTELRLVFILLNTVIIFAGTAWIAPVLPWALGASLAMLPVLVFKTQRKIWAMDMREKAERTEPQSE
ncbi:MAG: hypothetical protein KAI66_02960 [Lentisphaeria bacterium]|nr:hypothetical protein [Lentisphaeria bacterium]